MCVCVCVCVCVVLVVDVYVCVFFCVCVVVVCVFLGGRGCFFGVGGGWGGRPPRYLFLWAIFRVNFIFFIFFKERKKAYLLPKRASSLAVSQKDVLTEF